jgi:hypothetical protein
METPVSLLTSRTVIMAAQLLSHGYYKPSRSVRVKRFFLCAGGYFKKA